MGFQDFFKISFWAISTVVHIHVIHYHDHFVWTYSEIEAGIEQSV